MQRENIAKELNRYYSEIKKHLSIDKKAKRKFICELENSIDEYLCNNTKVTYQEILDEFGTPESIALSFMEQEDSEETVKRASQKRKLYGFIIISIILLIIITIATYAFVVLDTYNTNHGYFSEEVIEEEYIESN